MKLLPHRTPESVHTVSCLHSEPGITLCTCWLEFSAKEIPIPEVRANPKDSQVTGTTLNERPSTDRSHDKLITYHTAAAKDPQLSEASRAWHAEYVEYLSR